MLINNFPTFANNKLINKHNFNPMKKLYSLITVTFALLLCFNTAKATIVIIHAQGTNTATNLFNPNVATANCGDTIKWILSSGIHTTAPTNIPTGAIPWPETQITANGFMYVVTIAGTYNYTCHPTNPPGGHMPGSIVVTCPTGVSSIDAENTISAYPNPFTNKITFDVTKTDLINLYNCLGEKVKTVSFKNNQSSVEIDAADLPKGMYFYSFYNEGLMVGTRKLVKN